MEVSEIGYCDAEIHKRQPFGFLNHSSLNMVEEEDIHPHCLYCINLLKCTISPKSEKSCNMGYCPLECGARFHLCKLKEHRLLCPNEKVSCINVGYGCPAQMLRTHQSKHLISCPASIIHCSEEWDRWPIHLHNKKTDQMCGQLDPQIRDHLDVSLAMRDQRMLSRWCLAASQGQSLTNHKFTISASSSLWVFRKWQNSREFSYPPGLEESVCKELCKTCKEAVKKPPNYCISNGHNSNASLDSEVFDSLEMSDKENCEGINNKKEERFGSTSTSKPKTVAKNLVKSDELPHYNLDDVLQLSRFGTIVYHQSSREGSIYVAADPSEPVPCMYNGSHNTAACQILDLKFRNPASTPPWCLPLGLDLNLEACSQHPPANFMYTFLCCQEFRRDEYGCHYKNVHSEIHGGLNGWLLERCPLAQYGCKFARKRFNPLPQNSHIVYNEQLESFGITYCSKDNPATECNSPKPYNKKPDSELKLLDLPFDVLQHIVRFLDSFSLSNLSLTSTALRDVCSTILKDRGLVYFKWERHKTKDDKYTWKMSKYKRWFFSSHFSPINTWTLEQKNNMANHLKLCPYFTRISHQKAFRYGLPINMYPSPDRQYSEPLKEIFELNTTKL